MKTIELKPRYKEQLEKQQDTKEILLYKMGISEAHYFQFQVEIGCRLVENVFGEYPELIEELLQNPKMEYWNWFKMQWAIEEMNVWKASKWMFETSTGVYFKSPKTIKDPQKEMLATWKEEMDMWAQSNEIHNMLHHHIIQVDPFRNLKQ